MNVFIKKKYTALLVLLLVLMQTVYGQSQAERDSMRKATELSQPHTTRVKTLVLLCFAYLTSNPDSAMYYGQTALEAARAASYPAGEVRALNGIAAIFSATGNPDKSLRYMLQAIKIARDNHLNRTLYNSIGNMGTLYSDMGDYRLAKKYYLESIANAVENKIENANVGDYYVFLGSTYQHLDLIDSAIYFVDKGFELFKKTKASANFFEAYDAYGDIYTAMHQPGKALGYYQQAIAEAIILDDYLTIANGMLKRAKLFNESGKTDSALYYAKQSLIMAKKVRSARIEMDASEFLTGYYKQHAAPDSAFKYAEILLATKDSIYNQDKLKNVQDLQFNEHLHEQNLVAQKTQLKNAIKLYALGGLLLIFIILLLLLWRNNKQKQKAYNLLQQQKLEISLQKNKADAALAELKSTQSQLIQSEKMASLGELTAGIAHEIQNPLNFVNNFSEVNKELIGEMKDEIEKGNYTDVKAIAKDIQENEEKINHHGKRADAIVKGMLQHSRSSNGVKEPTDINALADEYLRLAYHGLRAKDNSFNATIKTDFDQSIGNINIIPQDIGRVILNLLTNAFYAASLPSKGGFSDSDGRHEPTVWVSTKKTADKVLISVRDNGPGIPQKVLDKIFQPFFTTKPTGQGTGLGLSLSYDIVKAHGGELKVETKEARPDDPVGRGEGSTFIIQLQA